MHKLGYYYIQNLFVTIMLSVILINAFMLNAARVIVQNVIRPKITIVTKYAVIVTAVNYACKIFFIKITTGCWLHHKIHYSIPKLFTRIKTGYRGQTRESLPKGEASVQFTSLH
jgi:hypothetical protein